MRIVQLFIPDDPSKLTMAISDGSIGLVLTDREVGQVDDYNWITVSRLDGSLETWLDMQIGYFATLDMSDDELRDALEEFKSSTDDIEVTLTEFQEWKDFLMSNQKCDICNNVSDSLIEVMMVDGADVAQPMEPASVCQHCYETEVNAPGWGWSNDYASLDDYEKIGERLVGPEGHEETYVVYVLTEKAWNRLYQGRNGSYEEYRSYYVKELEDD